MAMFKTLKDLQNSTKKADMGSVGTDRVKRFFTIKPDESFQIRFRQELTEDSGNFTDAAGVAHVVRVHSNPADFTKNAICTGDDEKYGYKCWACEQIDKDRGWKAKQHLLLNVAVFNSNDEVWEPRVLDQKFTGAHVAESVVEYALEYGTLLDRTYKISRKGTKQQTQYTLIPLAPKDEDQSIKDLPMHDLEKVYRSFSYSEQAGFYLGSEDKAGASAWGDDPF
jgi:hypothetical protein